MDEAGDDFAPLEGVRDFGMELHGIEAALLIRHGGNRRRFVAADDLEAGREFGHLVAVAHPDFEKAMALLVDTIPNAVEEFRMAPGPHLGIAEFTSRAAFDLAAQLRGHGLHTVADAQHRHSQLEYDVRRLPVSGLVHRIGTAGQNDPLRLEVANEVFGNVEGMQFAIHLLFAHAAGDELRNLRAEIEDEDFLVGHVGNLAKRQMQIQ